MLEDLTGVRGATEKIRVKDRYVMVSWAFYDLEQKLTYKAAENNCAVIKVPPQYTSQCCPMCDYIERGIAIKSYISSSVNLAAILLTMTASRQ